ncbi:MAG TPA: hypothetical protein VIZ28_06325 [Chitinophagaceae bacterium]
MDFNITTELQQHLDTNEKLIWAGQPKKGVVFRTADIFLIPFSLLWCGFAVFWVIMASKGSILFAMFGIPFVVIGLIFVFGRFIIDAKQRGSTYYGLTEDRIIIKSGLFKKTIKSLNIRTLSDIEYNEKSDGSGTINIGPRNPFMRWSHGMNWWPGMQFTPALDMIQDVKKVYSKIIEIQKSK